jgi:hypothetical protein
LWDFPLENPTKGDFLKGNDQVNDKDNPGGFGSRLDLSFLED